MASDRDLISSEEHELNYVLKKWGKKQSVINREVLLKHFKEFKADAEWKPHNRENFYKYADSKNIKNNLVDRDLDKFDDNSESDITMAYENNDDKKSSINESEITQVFQNKDNRGIDNKKNISTTGTGNINNNHNTKQTERNKKKINFLPFILLGLLLLIIIFIILFFGFCKNNVTVLTTTSTTIEATTTTSTTITTTTIPPRIYTDESLTEYISNYQPIYFKADRTLLLKDEDKKIEKIAEYIKNYKFVEIVIEGHTANVGKPINEINLSKKRALVVKKGLQSKLNNIEIKIEGYGSKKEAVKNASKIDMHLNRRCRIIIIKTESNE